MLVPHVYAIVDLTKIDWRSVKYCYCKGPGYSVLYPATNSASASDKSNGARFVSATHVYARLKLLFTVIITSINMFMLYRFYDTNTSTLYNEHILIR